MEKNRKGYIAVLEGVITVKEENSKEKKREREIREEISLPMGPAMCG